MITNYFLCYMFQNLQEQSCSWVMIIGGTNGFSMILRHLSTSINICSQNLMYNFPVLTQFKYGLYLKLFYVIWNKWLDLNYVVSTYHSSWYHGMYKKMVECLMHLFNKNYTYFKQQWSLRKRLFDVAELRQLAPFFVICKFWHVYIYSRF